MLVFGYFWQPNNNVLETLFLGFIYFYFLQHSQNVAGSFILRQPKTKPLLVDQ